MSEGQIIFALLWAACVAMLSRPGRRPIKDPEFYIWSAVGWAIAWCWGRFILCSSHD